MSDTMSETGPEGGHRCSSRWRLAMLWKSIPNGAAQSRQSEVIRTI